MLLIPCFISFLLSAYGFIGGAEGKFGSKEAISFGIIFLARFSREKRVRLPFGDMATSKKPDSEFSGDKCVSTLQTIGCTLK